MTESNENYNYFFNGIDRYNRLREPGSPMPKLLVVLLLPNDPTQWLTLDGSSLIARKCAYWVSLKGAPISDNKSGKTIAIPRAQVLSVQGLRDVALKLSQQEELNYAV